MSPKRGFSLLEMIVALALGSLILVATGAALGNVTKIFRNTSGRDQALRDLAKAQDRKSVV